MKRLLSVGLLMLCLSLPVFAGHSVIGGSYCAPCGIQGCLCDPGEEPIGSPTSIPTKPKSNDLGQEALLALGVLLLLLRYKA